MLNVTDSKLEIDLFEKSKLCSKAINENSDMVNTAQLLIFSRGDNFEDDRRVGIVGQFEWY